MKRGMPERMRYETEKMKRKRKQNPTKGPSNHHHHHHQSPSAVCAGSQPAVCRTNGRKGLRTTWTMEIPTHLVIIIDRQQ